MGSRSGFQGTFVVHIFPEVLGESTRIPICELGIILMYGRRFLGRDCRRRGGYLGHYSLLTEADVTGVCHEQG